MLLLATIRYVVDRNTAVEYKVFYRGYPTHFLKSIPLKFTCEFSTFLAFITLTSLWSKMFEQKFTFTKKILDYTDFYLCFFKNHLNTWLFLVFQKKTARLPRELANQLQILRGISIFTVLFQKVSGVKKIIVINDFIFST